MVKIPPIKMVKLGVVEYCFINIIVILGLVNVIIIGFTIMYIVTLDVNGIVHVHRIFLIGGSSHET